LRIAVCSDEPHAAHEALIAHIETQGHEVLRFGALISGDEVDWAPAAEAAAIAVATGAATEGIFFCWTGTGISMAANKIAGIRAALCGDAETARGARLWNHANVLCLSNRLLTEQSGRTIMQAWLTSGDPQQRGADGVHLLNDIDARHRRTCAKTVPPRQPQ
jgi:ribose 5-phosphate isomerase B